MDIKKSILVAEDERPMANALTLKLTHEGYDVTTVYDGAAAVDSVEKKKFDLIMLDLVMPLMNGFDALAKFRLIKDFKTPIMVMTNLSQLEDEKKARELGATDFLIKSNTPLSEIVDKVKQVLA